MACEKASRRLRATLLKATRCGVSTAEVAGLPSAKKLVSQRDHDWKLAVLLLLMFGGGIIVALVCTTSSRGCSRIEDIVSIPFFSTYRLSSARVRNFEFPRYIYGTLREVSKGIINPP